MKVDITSWFRGFRLKVLFGQVGFAIRTPPQRGDRKASTGPFDRTPEMIKNVRYDQFIYKYCLLFSKVDISI